jgi:hypothetical protein
VFVAERFTNSAGACLAFRYRVRTLLPEAVKHLRQWLNDARAFHFIAAPSITQRPVYLRIRRVITRSSAARRSVKIRDVLRDVWQVLHAASGRKCALKIRAGRHSLRER